MELIETSDDDIESRVRATQIQAVVRLTPLCVAVNLLNVVIICTVFWRTISYWALCSWGLIVLSANTASLCNWWRTRNDLAPARASERAILRAAQQASFLALLWVFPLVVFINLATAEQQMFLMVVTTGMICAGGFALSTVQKAGVAFPLVLGVGAAIALIRSDLSVAVPLSIMLVLYVLIVVVSVINASRTFSARIRAELYAENQNQIISLLLRDFEENTADVLWETDSQSYLRQTSKKFAELMGFSRQALKGKNFQKIIEQNQLSLKEALKDKAVTALSHLSAALNEGQGFRDLKLPVQVSGQVRWWSLTAKPMIAGGWRGVISDVTAIHEAQHHIWQMAHYDAVTGLYNRHKFQKTVEIGIAETRGGHWSCAVLYIDLDKFKIINDTLGHSFGDRMLSIVGQRMQRQIRGQDLLARIGGDEFGIVLRRIDSPNEAIGAAQRILKALERPCDVDGVTVPVNACIGIAVAPSDGVNTDLLLKHADLALYSAKSQGTGVYRCYIKSMGVKVEKRLRIEQALKEALEKKSLHVVFQPQQQLDSTQITGFEALARWHHPELGEVPPDIFISVAEECGLIQELGAWVLSEVCRQMSYWPESIMVAVNLSPLQLLEKNFVEQALNELAKNNVNPHRLEFEITESLLLNDTVLMLNKLQELRASGIRIALDDFGTGYSAMAYLRRFPFDTLKIDRSFIHEITAHADALAIVVAIIEMAHALNISVVAEGIEDQETLNLMRQNKCDVAQGFFISRPLALIDIKKYLNSQCDSFVLN